MQNRSKSWLGIIYKNSTIMKQVKGNILKNAEWLPCTKTSEITQDLTKPSQSQQKLHLDLWKAGIYGRSGKFLN